MIRRKIRIISAATAILVFLCSCQSRTEKEFFENKARAESKSGIVYRTTYFAAHEEEDRQAGFPYAKAVDGKLCFVYLDSEGKEVQLTPATLTDARLSYEAAENIFLAPATLDGEKWGYVILDENAPDTENMNWNTDRSFDNAEAYNEGFAAASLNGKYGVIDLNGEFLIQPQYDAIKYCCFGVMPALENGEWYYINVSGEKVFGPFEDAESYAYGYAAVKKDGKWGFIDKNGYDATTFVYDEAYSVEDDEETGSLSAWVRTGDKWEQVEIAQ